MKDILNKLIAVATTLSILGITEITNAADFTFSQIGWNSGVSDIVQGNFSGEDLNGNGFLQFNPSLQEITAFNLESINSIPELNFTHSLDNLSLLTFDLSTNTLSSLESTLQDGDPDVTLVLTSYGGGSDNGFVNTRIFENGTLTEQLGASTNSPVIVNPATVPTPTVPESSSIFSLLAIGGLILTNKAKSLFIK